MAVIDISTPDNPTQVGSLIFPNIIRDIVIVEDYAYVIYSGVLQLVDISDPATPVKAGFYILEENGEAITVREDHAYVASGSRGLQIIDISDPIILTEVGWYDVYAKDVTLEGNYVYIASGYDGLQIIDVSNPTDPVEIGAYRWFGGSSYWRYIEHIAVMNEYVYILADVLGVLNVSDPTNPTMLSTYDVPSSSIALDGNYAYVGTESGLYVLDISDPTTVIAVAIFDTPDLIEDVTTENNYVYFVTRERGLRILDISDLENISQAGKYESPLIPRITKLANDYVYVAAWNSLHVFDITASTTFSKTGACDLPSYIGDMTIAASYIYATNPDSSLYVIDISNPYSPTMINSISVPNAVEIAMAGNYAYIGGGGSYDGWGSQPYGGFNTVDISNPTNPTIVNSHILVGSYEDMAIADDYIYISTDLDGTGSNYDLWVFDVSDPLNPIQIGQYDTYAVVSIAIEGNYAYLGTRGEGVRIMDISNPHNLTEVGFYNTPGNPLHIVVDDDYAYIADGSLRILDISNLVTPTEIDAYEALLGIRNLAAAGGYISAIAATDYFSNGGLFIFRAVGTISGRVLDIYNTHFPGVTIKADINYSITTNVTGTYSLTSLAAGSYILTPTLSGYAFHPPTRTVTVPPDAGYQNFTILPAPVSTTLVPSGTMWISQTLTFTDTQGLPTHLTFPPGSVDHPTRIVVTPTLISNPPPGWAFTEHAFDIAAYQDGALLPTFTFNRPVTATIHYSDADVRLITDDKQPALFWWDGSAWVAAATACEIPFTLITQQDSNAEILSIPICRTGHYALLGLTHQAFFTRILR